MSLSRRRFLAVAAACAATGGQAAVPHRWRGRALGAEAEIVVHGPAASAQAALAAARERIAAVEAEFNLYDPASSLSRLNRDGRLEPLPALWGPLISTIDQVHRVTGGLFDPTVQSVWPTLARGQRPQDRSIMGWHRVQIVHNRITLKPGQAMTFNGIAQGYATDLVAQTLREHGFDQTLGNIGEYRGAGEDWKIGISDHRLGLVGYRTLRDGALATTSPGALTFATGQSHVIHPQGAEQPLLWSTVTVEAEPAILADAMSTALALSDLPLIHQVRADLPALRRVTLIDDRGDLITV